MAIQKGCHCHHQYHHNLGQRNCWKCPIQMCFELEELNLKVAMAGLEMRVGTVLGTWDEQVNMVTLGFEW